MVTVSLFSDVWYQVVLTRWCRDNFELSGRGLIPALNINCQVGASQVGLGCITWCTIPQIDVKLDIRLPALVGGRQISQSGVLSEE